jgi:chromosome segregation ATPase
MTSPADGMFEVPGARLTAMRDELARARLGIESRDEAIAGLRQAAAELAGQITQLRGDLADADAVIAGLRADLAGCRAAVRWLRANRDLIVAALQAAADLTDGARVSAAMRHLAAQVPR